MLIQKSGGTAIARPVATAIAGLSPSDLAALGLPSQLAHKAMKDDQFRFVFQSNNYPFVRPAEWNSKLPEAKNRASSIDAIIDDRAPVATDSESVNRRMDAERRAAAEIINHGDDGLTRKLHREQLQQVPKLEGISRDQFLGDVFSHQYNWPYNPYDLYVPLY